jgi:hypothetical protein
LAEAFRGGGRPRVQVRAARVDVGQQRQPHPGLPKLPQVRRDPLDALIERGVGELDRDSFASRTGEAPSSRSGCG